MAYPGPSNFNGQPQMSEYDSAAAVQASIYTPQPWQSTKTGALHASLRTKGHRTVLRKGGGSVWEDQTLLEWDPKHFRLFIGNLGNDVNDDDLEKVFGNASALGVSSFVKAKVVRDRITTKTKGFGFVAYEKAEDYMKAWRAMDGKYVGSRPITIKKATTGVQAVEIGDKKARKIEKEMKKRQKEGYQRSQRGGGTVAQQVGTSYIRR